MLTGTCARSMGPISETSPMLFGRISRRDYRHAVAQVIFDVKAAHKLSNERLAEILGVDEKTIRNAEDESNGCLEGPTLLNIAVFFGEDAIRAVRALYLGGGIAEEVTVADRLDRIERETAALRKEMTG